MITNGVCATPVASYGMSPINAIDIFVGPTGSVDFASPIDDPVNKTPLLTASRANIDVIDFSLNIDFLSCDKINEVKLRADVFEINDRTHLNKQ